MEIQTSNIETPENAKKSVFCDYSEIKNGEHRQNTVIDSHGNSHKQKKIQIWYQVREIHDEAFRYFFFKEEILINEGVDEEN